MADEIRVEDDFFDVDTISLEIEGGKVIECAILDEFEALGRTYVALAPINDDDTLGDETFLYRCEDDGEDYIDLEYIDDVTLSRALEGRVNM